LILWRGAQELTVRTSDMVKSKFWRAADLRGQPPVRLTIADVTEELVGRGSRQDLKCFLWFSDHAKGLQLNKSRVAVLELAYGPDSDLWMGKRVRLSFDPTVVFGGQAVGGVKLETPPGIIYTPNPEIHTGWGEAPPGRPPAPVWDENRQMWITPQAPTPNAAPARPPAPVWDEASQSWLTPGQPKPSGPPQTISQRVNAQHPEGQSFDPKTGEILQAGDDPEFGHPEIPF
jgi:hypothetical protein